MRGHGSVYQVDASRHWRQRAEQRIGPGHLAHRPHEHLARVAGRARQLENAARLAHAPRRGSNIKLGVMAELKNLFEEQALKAAAAAKAKAEADERKLRAVLEEILETEERYGADLRQVHGEFLTPLREVLDGRAHIAIFSNIEQLLELHCGALNADLEPAREANVPLAKMGEAIAKAFITLLPFFKMYSVYCGAKAASSEALDEARADLRRVDEVLTAREERAGASSNMLFRPVQRMCVYPLLFQQAVKSASPGTPTHDLFKKALDTCSKVVNEVNENVRGQEAQLRTASIVLAEVTGGSSMRDLLEATRHIQMEAMVAMKAQSGLSMEWRVRRQYKWCDPPPPARREPRRRRRRRRPASPSPSRLRRYVFTDVLLICRPNRFGDQYHKKMILTLADCSISRSKGAGPPPKEAEPEVSMSFKPSMSLTSRQQAAAAAARGGGVSPGASSSKTSALKEIEEGLKEASARAASPVSVAGTNPAARKRWQTALQKAREQGLVKTKARRRPPARHRSPRPPPLPPVTAPTHDLRRSRRYRTPTRTPTSASPTSCPPAAAANPNPKREASWPC